ncbi:hypothetical protein KDX31_19835 (plasmid) [Amphritea atlantica]|uniref:Type 4 fimbrial biogenesis protein PilX N-terminal domain-containing protein n=1 Tax=Amphritea atlantica TaxID=355243 RepID=A0ABY5H1V3_9GAMM|nr:hypothetical protein KDX31_19835 [Amphritea atlantica]
MISITGIDNTQRGATLVVALTLLLVMTLMATTSLQSNVLQSRMAANLQDQTVAFEASETVLLYAEMWLAALKVAPELTDYDSWNSGDTAFIFDSRNSSALQQQLAHLGSVNNWIDRAKPASDFNPVHVARTHEQPRVSFEVIDFSADDKTLGYLYGQGRGVVTFRLYGRSTGVTGNSEVVLISEYRKRFR